MAAEETSPKDPDPSGTESADFMPPPPPAGYQSLRSGVNRVFKKLDNICLKTNLDLDACRRIAAELTAKKDSQQKDVVQSAPSVAFKAIQPIENYRTASPCRAQWENMSGTDAFKICRQCGLHVYNFSGVDLPAIKELVVQREGKENPSFYRRKDGKFLTTDCPVGVKQRRLAIMTVATVVAVLALAIATALTAPRPQPAMSTGPTNEAAQVETTESSRGGPGAIGTTGANPAPNPDPAKNSKSRESDIYAPPPILSTPAIGPVTGTQGAQAVSSGASPGVPAQQAAGSSPSPTAAAGSSLTARTSAPPTTVDSTMPTGAPPVMPLQQQAPVNPAAQGGAGSQPGQMPGSSHSSSQPANPYVQYYK